MGFLLWSKMTDDVVQVCSGFSCSTPQAEPHHSGRPYQWRRRTCKIANPCCSRLVSVPILRKKSCFVCPSGACWSLLSSKRVFLCVNHFGFFFVEFLILQPWGIWRKWPRPTSIWVFFALIFLSLHLMSDTSLTEWHMSTLDSSMLPWLTVYITVSVLVFDINGSEWNERSCCQFIQ